MKISLRIFILIFLLLYCKNILEFKITEQDILLVLVIFMLFFFGGAFSFLCGSYISESEKRCYERRKNLIKECIESEQRINIIKQETERLKQIKY
jgi:hypothetical protein